MAIQIDNKDGWLFPDPISNEYHDITIDDLNTLMLLAHKEDLWAENVRQAVVARDDAIKDGSWRNKPKDNWLIEELQIKNTAGTIVQYPYGLRAITFPSKRHLFRGERKKYPATIPSLNRIVNKIGDPKEKELYRVLAYL